MQIFEFQPTPGEEVNIKRLSFRVFFSAKNLENLDFLIFQKLQH